MPKIDLSNAPVRTSCLYPGKLADHCKGRSKIALGNLGGLDQFGVNLTRLAPGAASAHQHWHQKEDEFIYMLEGEAVLVEDDGETVLKAGDVATFKAGVANGHMVVNRSDADVVLLEVGTRSLDEVATYTDPEVDMKVVKENGAWTVLRKNGEPY
ncbi:cupin domain-containing protein [Hyphococcus luteus]|uniref:Transcriptional regulator n=1 Tax=Hyphococcus luteus TaxID=2058213 RepID=A0A2S7K6K5_9PROT|nr:cupin domain-containing protein [Marinicaulis flavus]PQA88122.1 transcriptional regulator [Marinicaulis flavus]